MAQIQVVVSVGDTM